MRESADSYSKTRDFAQDRTRTGKCVASLFGYVVSDSAINDTLTLIALFSSVSVHFRKSGFCQLPMASRVKV